MIINYPGNALVSELLANPSGFHEQGRAYELLQDYFRGYPVATLRPLLTHEDALVRSAAVWIVSELGMQGCSLIHEVIPLINSGDRQITYHALEIAIVCSVGENVHEFAHVARSLESDDEVIRVLAMRLISRASQSQLEAGAKSAAGTLGDIHEECLVRLSRYDALAPEQVLRMINDAVALTRRYGAIAARKLSKKFPNLVASAAASPDPDVSRFARELP